MKAISCMNALVLVAALAAVVNAPPASAVLLGQSTVAKEIESGRATVTGDASRIDDLLGMLVKFDPLFNIVTP